MNKNENNNEMEKDQEKIDKYILYYLEDDNLDFLDYLRMIKNFD